MRRLVPAPRLLFIVNIEIPRRPRSDSTLSLKLMLVVRLSAGGKYYPLSRLFGVLTHRHQF